MKKSFDFTELKNAKRLVVEAAANVAKAEADIVVAEEKLIKAQKDDGVTDAAKIVTIIESAERSLRIRRIEANRFGAKLSEAEEACESICLTSLDPLITALNDKADAEIDRIRTAMLPQIGEVACDSEQFLELVHLADPVSACKEYAHKIIDLKPGHNSHISQRGVQHILEVLLGAEPLL